ncbi:MAG: hypothetical protein JSV88_29765, partial [Candidatus Aminicenantes bacterium]
MKTIRYFTVFILVLFICQINVAEKRVNPKPMKELTDPSSPSYVPYPYPKNRKEIIEDLKYAINKLFVDKKGIYVDENPLEKEDILVLLMEEKSAYKIGEIIKVKNRTYLKAHDYNWLILIIGDNGEIAARVSMTAEGLFGAAVDTRNAAKSLR